MQNFSLFHQKISNFSVSLLLVICIAVLTGCGDGTPAATGGGSGGAAAPTFTIALSTNSISAGVSATVTATLQDAAGAGITGAVIAFSTNSTYGQLNPTTALTVNGVATTTLSVANNAPSGADSVSATVQILPSTAPASASGLSAATGYAVGGAVAPTVGSVTVTSGAASMTADGFSSTIISAEVRDTSGAVISGATVNFGKSAGALSATAANTNASGIAQVTLTASTVKGNATVTASSGGSSGSVNITFVPGAPALITLSLSSTATAPGGVVTINAIVTDQFSNLVGAGQAVGFASSTGSTGSSTGGTFSAASVNTNVIGEASTSYTAGTCATATCTDILTVTAGTGALSTINLSVNSNSTSVAGITVMAGYTDITADGISYTAIRATVIDTANAGVQGVVVAFAATAGILSSTEPPTITAAATAITDANGVAQLFLIAPITTGNATVTANTAGFSSSVIVTYVPGVPAAIGMNAQPSSVLLGGSTTLTIAAVDANGNPVGAGQTINFSTNNVLGIFSSLSGTTDANGRVSVTYTASTTAGTEVLTARATNGISNTTNLTVASDIVVVGSISVAPTTASITAGGATTLLNATVRDTTGQPILGASVSFSTSAGTLSAASAITNASGVATVTLTSGANILTASVTASSSGYTAITSVTYTAGVPAAISLNPAPNTAIPGGTSTITAAVLDGNGNPVAGEVLTFSFAQQQSGTPALNVVTATTDVNGLARVTYTAGANAGTDIITATTSNAITAAGASRATITVASNAVVVGSIVATTSKASIPVTTGTTQISATVKDTAGVALAGQTVTFVTSSGALSAVTTTDLNGVATATLTAGASILTATVSATAGGYTSNVNVVFTAGVAATVTVGAAPAAINVAGTSTLTAFVVDASGNPVAGETMTFAFTAKGSGIPTLGSTTAITSTNGLAVAAYTAGANAGTDTISATTSNAVAGSVSITSSAATIVVGGVELTTGATSIPAGGTSTVVRANVTDINGAAAAGITVNFTTSAGTLSAASAVTDSTGFAQVTLTSSNNLGTATIMANASGFVATASVNFVAGNPSAINLSANPATVSSGATSTLSATVVDAQGNPVAGQTVTFSIPTNTSGATLTPATAVTDADGVAITAYTAGATIGTDTLQATLTNGLFNTTTIAVIASVTPSAASLTLAASPTTVKSDNSNAATVTVTALSASNSVVPNVVVTLGADTGVLSAQTVTTGSNGQATFTFSSGVTSKVNRTATITATAGAVTTQIPVQIVGSTVTVTTSTATLPDDGTSPVTLTITTKDAGGNTISGATVTLTETGGGNVTLTPSSGTTDANGQLSVTAEGAAGGAGTVTVSVDAVGATATSTMTVSPSAATFAIDMQILNGTPIANSTLTAMSIGDSLVVQVNAPAPTTSVVFATSIGVWDGTASVVTVSAAGGVTCGTITTIAGQACATLTTTLAGLANVQVYDLATPDTSDYLTVAMTAAASTANSITIQASPALVPKSTGTTTGYSTLTASVKDANGYPVGGAPVAFEILNPTGGGETVSPVVVFSAMTTSGGIALGDAPTTFTSGSLSSDVAGVQIRASVVGTAIKTEAMGADATASGNDASVVIGGTAGSMAFGQATGLNENSNASAYILPMSVLVADVNGNPAPLGTAVTLSVWPIAWSTGSGCTVDADTVTSGTFLNEDTNENLILDAGEDGYRVNSLGPQAGGYIDNLATSTNSAGGTLPGTVYTDANGVATFDLTYGKTSAIWIVDRIRARTTVQGSEAVGEINFRLAPLKKDVDPDCLLPDSPYYF